MEKNINLSINPDGIAEIVFDVKNEKVNVLSTVVMLELDEIINEIGKNQNIKLLLIISAKKDVFIAGADIHEISGINSEQDAKEKSFEGQEILNKIEKLPFPTLCIINGACLGGGLELALACTFRIVTDNKKVQLGLPETSLGLIPGFGGTIRLPRLVGLNHALNMILTGKPANAAKALKMNLADALYSESFMNERINGFIKQISSIEGRNKIYKKRKKRKLSEMLMEKTAPGKMLTFYIAGKNLKKKTRGFYPALDIALETIKKNYKKNPDRALSIERNNFSKIAVSQVSKRLIDIFFLNEELKKAYQSDGSTVKKIETGMIKFASVLGAGKMGGGIAWLLSNSLIPVRMKDISWNFILAGYKTIKDIYSELKKIKKLDEREIGLRMQKISAGVDYSGMSSSDLIIEAIVEDKDIKIKTLKEIESFVRPDAIIATNTSSLSVDELSSELKYPDRFIGFHFFNPVNRMPLIEIVCGKKTSDLTIQRMVAFARYLKKTPVVVKDCNGFLVNRILMAYLNEAVLMMEQGVDFAKIDRAIYDFGFPMGPFTLLDEIGIKVGYKVAKNLFSAYPERSEMGKIFTRIASNENITGKSLGKGFFIYNKKNKIPNKDIYNLLEEFKIEKNGKINNKEIIERCLLRMMNEASICLEENIIDKAGFLDMALITGMGFPPFLGGLLRYADDEGIYKIVADIEKYREKYGDRFKPSNYIIDLKNNGRRFYS